MSFKKQQKWTDEATERLISFWVPYSSGLEKRSDALKGKRQWQTYQEWADIINDAFGTSFTHEGVRNRLNYIQKRKKENIEEYRGSKKLSKLSGRSTEDLMASQEFQRFLQDGKESWLAAAYNCMKGDPALALDSSFRSAGRQPHARKRLRRKKSIDFQKAMEMRKSNAPKMVDKISVPDKQKGEDLQMKEEEGALRLSPPDLPNMVTNLTSKSGSTRPRSHDLLRETQSQPGREATSPERTKTARKRKFSLSGWASGPQKGRAANRETIALTRLLEDAIIRNQENMGMLLNVMASETRETRNALRHSSYAMCMEAKLNRLQSRLEMYEEFYHTAQETHERRSYREKIASLADEIEECEKDLSDTMVKLMNEDNDAPTNLNPGRYSNNRSKYISKKQQ